MFKIRTIFLLVLFPIILFGQELDKENSPKLTSVITNIEGKNVRAYPIKCSFTSSLTDEQFKLARNVNNWKIEGEKRSFQVDSITFTFKKDVCLLHGSWGRNENLNLVFSEREIPVTNEESNWDFGKGKPFDLNFRFLTQQELFYAFDYDFNVKIAERHVGTFNRNIGLYTFSLDLTSNGTFASDDTVRNGTQSSLGVVLRPYLFVKDRVYFSKFDFSYQLETRMNESKDMIFDVTDYKLKLGAEFDVPLTDRPIIKLHSKTGYARVAMPLKLSFDYLFSDEKENELEKLDRLDFKAKYELAFSPYLIVQGEWNQSWFINAPTGTENSVTYYSVGVAQDLDAVKQTLGFLKIVLGKEEEIRGKNFIFFRHSKGQKAPAFVDVNETSIGFGTYF